MTYPNWCLFPRYLIAPSWVPDFIRVLNQSQKKIDSQTHNKFDSDQVLKALSDGLCALGWEIETGKTKEAKIYRPVLFGDNGVSRVSYEIDGWHPLHKAVLEIESGRGWQGNALYRDLIRTSIVQDAEFLVLGMRNSYSYGSVKHQNDFQKAREQLDAIYASGRLNLPFNGILLFGW
jgi:hypothetical protein